MTYDISIFDYKDLPSAIKSKLQLEVGESDIFRGKIYNIFDMAKDCNIDKLDVNQIAVAYYRAYTTKNPKDIKTVSQLKAKLYNIVREDEKYKAKYPNSKVKTLKKVPNERSYFFA